MRWSCRSSCRSACCSCWSRCSDRHSPGSRWGERPSGCRSTLCRCRSACPPRWPCTGTARCPGDQHQRRQQFSAQVTGVRTSGRRKLCLSWCIRSSSVLLYVHSDHNDYLGRGGAQDGHLDFHTAPELWKRLPVQCSFPSTETIRFIRDGEPRTATSTFTQLLNSGRDFQFSVPFRPQKPSGLLGTGSPGRPPRLSHSSWALEETSSSVFLSVHRNHQVY